MADNCTYKLTLNDGKIKEFKSEEDLNSFVRDNKKLLVSTVLAQKRIFSTEMNVPQQTEALLDEKNKGMHLRKEDHVYYKDLPGGARQEGYTSGTQFISKKHNLGSPLGEQEYLTPAFNKENYFRDLREELTDNGLSADAVDKIIAEKVATFDMSSISGTSFHDIAENFVLKGYKTGADIKTDYPQLSDEQADLYFKSMEAIVTEIKKAHGEDAILKPEFIIVDDDKKITGTVDLLVIDNKGKLHIYDYKTSFKDIGDWNQIKKNSVDYQLTLYKQILLRQGFDVGKTKYIPIKINEYNQENNTVEAFQVETMMDSTQSSRGDVLFKISYLLPHTFKPKTDFIVDNKAISEVLLKAFNYEVKNVLANKAAAGNTAKQQLDYLLNNSPRHQDYKKQEFIWMPAIGGNSRNAKKLYTSETEAKNLQLVDAYLNQLQAYNDGLSVKIIDYINNTRKALEDGKAIDNGVLWGSDDPMTAEYLNNVFRKYINSSEWQPFESDVMADLGIVAFENQETNEVDLISITGKSLSGNGSTPALQNGRRKLLGNVMSDTKSTDLGFYKDINNGDIEVLKAFAFIQNNQSTFKDKKIGNIAAIQLNSNQTIGGISTQTLTTVQQQWKGLVDHIDDFELKQKTWKVSEKDNYESLISFVKEMFNEDDYKITINKNRASIVKNLKYLDKISETKDRIKILAQIQAGLLEDVGTRQAMAGQASEKKELLFLIASSIAQLSNVNYSVEEDAMNFGNIMSDNLMTYMPDRIRTSLVKVVVDTINKGLNDAKHKFNKDSSGLLDLHNEFYKGVKATDYQIKFVGNNYEFFENLIEKSSDRYSWVFKNPDTDASLSPDEAKYIKKYLTHINDIRRKKLIEKNGEGSEAVLDFDMNPPRDIPLMKASGYSALKNKGVKGYIKDQWESLANDTRMLESAKDYEAKIKLQTQMFNQFDWLDLDKSAREGYLENTQDNDLEMDLESVIYAYTMANAKQVVFNEKVLPIVNTMKVIAMLSNNFHYNKLDNIEEYLHNITAAQVFGQKIQAGENATLAKSAQVLTGAVSKLTLGLSIPTMMNEVFNNSFLSISKVFGASIGRKQFGKDSWMKAEGLVWTDKMTKSQLNIGKMNFSRQLNAMYSIVESDLGQLQHANMSTSTAYGRNFSSNVMMKLNQLPNYAHRMSFFVAQMIEDGVIKTSGSDFSENSAMKLDGEKLVYDARLDDRFKLYLANRNNAPVGQETEWKAARAYYLKVEELLKEEEAGIDEATGLISRPYENKTRDSLKSVADEVFGGYDPENKVLWTQTAFGQLFNQFKNWMWAKKHRIWSDTSINGRQGKWVWDADKEEQVWKNDIMEGFGNSMYALFQEVKESRDFMGSWDKLAPERKERILWALSDLVLFALFSGLAAYLIGEFNAKEFPIGNMMAKSMRNATSDLAIWSAAATVITPNNQIPIFGMINKVVQGTAGLVTDDQRATQQMMNSLGLYRTLHPVYATVMPEEE